MKQEMTLDSLPDVLTTREAAAVLRCSKAHVCNLMGGRVLGVPPLPSVRLGRRRLVRREVLAEWLKGVETKAAGR